MNAKDYAFEILNNLSKAGVGRLNLTKLKQSGMLKAALTKVPDEQKDAVKAEILAALDNLGL